MKASAFKQDTMNRNCLVCSRPNGMTLATAVMRPNSLWRLKASDLALCLSQQLRSLNAINCCLASLYLLTTLLIVSPNRPEGEIGASRRNALFLSSIPVRLSHRCRSFMTIAAIEWPMAHAMCFITRSVARRSSFTVSGANCHNPTLWAGQPGVQGLTCLTCCCIDLTHKTGCYPTGLWG